MLKGKTALVTGSTQGLGLAIAERLAAEGCNVMLNGFGKPDAIEADRQRIEADHGVRALHHGADLADPAQIAALVEAAFSAFGGVDILVNNAVVRHFAPIEQFKPEDWDRALAVNLSAAFHATRLLVPGMRQRNFGRIVNISSIFGLRGTVNRVDYVTTKTGLLGLTRAIAVEVSGTDITCNAICPGPMPTPGVTEQLARVAAQKKISVEEATKEMLSQGRPNGRLIPTGAVAGLIAYLCSEEGREINGVALPVDAGLTAS